MPRARTPEERARVEERLLENGRRLFARVGLTKATVADLARGAGIGKGTLYQFYDSKEALFFAIQEREEEAFRSALLAEVESADSPREAVVRLLRSVSERLEAHPFLRLLLDPETLDALLLRLPPEHVEAHRDGDRAFFLELARKWKRRRWLKKSVDPERFVDVLTAMFVLSTSEQLVGRETLRGAADEIAEAIASRWCPA